MMETKENLRARVGMSLEPDCWQWSGKLEKGIGPCDEGWPGCQFYVQRDWDKVIKELAVNVMVTGRKSFYVSFLKCYRVRVRIEFVGDCEPSTYCSGWLYMDSIEF